MQLYALKGNRVLPGISHPHRRMKAAKTAREGSKAAFEIEINNLERDARFRDRY